MSAVLSTAQQDPEFTGNPGEYLSYLQSKRDDLSPNQRGIESIATDAEKRFQEQVMQPMFKQKAADRGQLIQGLKSIFDINQFGIPSADYSLAFQSGGRVGFADGPEDPSKRKFMKILGGLASLPIVGKFIKVAEPVAPAVVEGAKSVPPYFLRLVDKIRALGRSGPGPKDRSESFIYGDYEMDIDYDTGAIDIKKIEQGMFGDEIAPTAEINMSYRPGVADEVTGGKPPDEYEEFTVRPDGDGKMKDVEEGVPDDVIDEGSISKEELEQLIIRDLANE